MHKIIILILAIALVGCSTTRFPREEIPQQVPAKHVSTNPVIQLNKAKIWPLKINGIYLQKVTATINGKQQSFSVHLTADERMIEIIAFSDMAGRLYKLKYTPQGVHWEGSSSIPSIIKPENIMTDFLMIHLSAKELQNSLPGSHVRETADATGKTRVVMLQKVLRKITYKRPLGTMWEHVTIENPAARYRLDIQTVEQ
jgi:hypothetical protein